MDEENQNQEKEMPDKLLEQGLKLLQKAFAKIATAIIGFIAAHIVPILIVVGIILAVVVLIPAIDNLLDELSAEEINEVTYQVVKDYCSIDETGIHINKEEVLKNIMIQLSQNGIDLNDLGFGDDGDYTVYGSNTVDGNDLTVVNMDPNSQAAQYIYKFLSASLAGEFPYISGSDEEVQGIIKIKRRKNEAEDAKELTFIGYTKFQEMLESNDTDVKDDIVNYFSLDEDWNLCIAKPYTKTVNTYSHESLISSISEYTISEVKIPYRNMVAQYTVPFLFLIDLQLNTNNVNYVEAVAELMTKQSEIEFTIFDSITTNTNVYQYTANRHGWEPKEIQTSGETVVGVSRTEWVSTDYGVDDKTETTIETDAIKANVTKAKTWIIEQETNYEMQTNYEYPYGENGTTTDLTDQDDPGGHGSWDTQRKEYQYTKIIRREWTKSGDTKTIIIPSEFMGLWANETGTYVKGAPYKAVGDNRDGKIVKYKTLNGTIENDPVIINIVTAREELYELLENNVTTQMHAELMREMIKIYMEGEELTYSFGVKFEKLFNPEEFLESDWNKIGSGFWWPINGTPTYETITSKFGYRGNIGLSGASKFHKGIDIGIPTGTEIIASADGVVEAAYYSDSAGFYIKINHSNGFKTVYMHNSKLLVTVGQEVKQGDVIALSGNTGNSTGPHLHFGIEINGEYVDPLDYVSQQNRRPSSTIPDVPANVEAWTTYIEEAFAELGYVMTQEKVEAILRQIDTESGGNQTIIQGIVDSNSGKKITITSDGICPWCSSSLGDTCGNTNIGHGLLQFIPTTFYNNMIPGHTNIFNGYDQIITCIVMLESRSGPYTDYIGKGTGWG